MADLFQMAFGALLLDIEGTTTPISFVHDELFPFVLKNLDSYLEEKQSHPDFVSIFKDLIALDSEKVLAGTPTATDGDADSMGSLDIGRINRIIRNLMASDQKLKPLKELQGLMWESGYNQGVLKGVVYDDVIVTLKNLQLQGIKIFIYSSGSVAAQKLLFKHSNHGNLLPLIAGHFDTNVGPKSEASSYIEIARQIGLKEHEVLFLSDNINECLAAMNAGMQTKNVYRPGNATIPNLAGIEQIHSFEQLI